jgi:hypothetical protein
MEVQPIPPAPQPPQPDRGHIILGVLLGFVCQIGFVILGMLAGWFIANSTTKGLVFMFSSWGVTQWIALIPLIRQHNKKGRTRTAQGLIVIGCLGLLLSSACALALS